MGILKDLLATPSTFIALSFSGIGVLLVAGVVIADLAFQRRLDPANFDLLKLLVTASIGYAFGTGQGATAVTKVLAARREDA